MSTLSADCSRAVRGTLSEPRRAGCRAAAAVPFRPMCGICGLVRPAEAGRRRRGARRAALPTRSAIAARTTARRRPLGTVHARLPPAARDRPRDRRPAGRRTSAATSSPSSTASSTTSARCAPSSRARATISRAPATRRRCRTSTSSTATASSSTSTACSRSRSGTRRRQRLAPRARPLRQEAAALDAAAGRHGRVRLGAEGAARLPRGRARASTSSGSTPTSRSATCRATGRRCRDQPPAARAASLVVEDGRSRP